MTDEVLRNYLGVLSFLLAALSFLANERREAIASLRTSSRVSCAERWIAIASTGLLLIAAAGLVVVTWPAVSATALEPGDVLRLHSVVREAFVMGWLLLAAVTLALGGLVRRAWGITLGQGE